MKQNTKIAIEYIVVTIVATVILSQLGLIAISTMWTHIAISTWSVIGYELYKKIFYPIY